MYEESQLNVVDGHIASEESWVYVWIRPRTDEVFYVGATGLPLEVRTWLHLNHEDPNIGRVRSNHSEALQGSISVRGFPVPPGVDRQDVKSVVRSLVNGTEPPPGVPSEALQLARRIVNDLAEQR